MSAADMTSGLLVGVRGMPEQDIESLGVMGWGLDAARKFFRRRRRPPLLSDTYERSRRDTARKLLVMSLRFFSVFTKSWISPKITEIHFKNAISGEKCFPHC